MAYSDYEYYQSSFCGDVLAEDNAAKYLELASDELDTLTFGRLTFAYPELEAHQAKIQRAVCAIAEAIYFVDTQRKAAAAQAVTSSDGTVTYRGAMQSISSGRESITYSSGTTSAGSSSYAAAAASTASYNALISSIAARYLANIPDANGVNLLYAGVVRNV